MAANLFPIRDADGSPLRYAERDWIGVEADGATHLRGLNANLAWGQRAYDAMAAEHDAATGKHRTIKVPRIALEFGYNASSGYIPRRAFGVLGATATVVGPVGDGLIEIKLPTPMPNTQYRAIGLRPNPYAFQPSTLVVVRHVSVIDTSTFRARRWERTGAPTPTNLLATKHGEIFVVIHGVP